MSASSDEIPLSLSLPRPLQASPVCEALQSSKSSIPCKMARRCGVPSGLGFPPGFRGSVLLEEGPWWRSKWLRVLHDMTHFTYVLWRRFDAQKTKQETKETRFDFDMVQNTVQRCANYDKKSANICKPLANHNDFHTVRLGITSKFIPAYCLNIPKYTCRLTFIRKQICRHQIECMWFVTMSLDPKGRGSFFNHFWALPLLFCLCCFMGRSFPIIPMQQAVDVTTAPDRWPPHFCRRKKCAETWNNSKRNVRLQLIILCEEKHKENEPKEYPQQQQLHEKVNKCLSEWCLGAVWDKPK